MSSPFQRITFGSAAVLTGVVLIVALAAACVPRVAEVKLTDGGFKLTNDSTLSRRRIPPALQKWADRGLSLRIWQRGVPLTARSSLRILDEPSPAYRIRDNAFLYVNASMLASLRDESTTSILAVDTRPLAARIIPPATGAIFVLGALGVLSFFKEADGKAAPTTPHRRHALDSLRGIAAITVILGHAFKCFFPQQWATDVYLDGRLMPAPLIAEWIKHSPFQPNFSGPLMVRVFWILSGVVLSLPILSLQSHSRVWQATAKRYFRLMPLAFITTMASYFCAASGAYSYAEFTSATHFDALVLGNWHEVAPQLSSALYDALVFGSRFNLPLWTISYEFGGSMILFAVLGCTLGLKRRELVWLAVLLYLLVIREYFFTDFIVGLFLAEVLVRRGHDAEKTISRFVALAIFILAVLAGPAYLGWLNPSSRRLHPDLYEILLLLAAFNMVALAALSRPVIRFLMWKPLIWLGERSFSLYAVHAVLTYLVGDAAAVFFVRHGLPIVASCMMAIVVFLLATVLGADWLLKHVDRPSMTLANAVGRWFLGAAVSAAPAQAEAGATLSLPPPT